MPLMSICGPEKHADYSVRSDQRSLCKQPSVALWTRPTVGRDKVCHRGGCYVDLWWHWWHHFWEELIWNREAFIGWSISLRLQFIYVSEMLFHVFQDWNIKMSPMNQCWNQCRRHMLNGQSYSRQVYRRRTLYQKFSLLYRIERPNFLKAACQVATVSRERCE